MRKRKRPRWLFAPPEHEMHVPSQKHYYISRKGVIDVYIHQFTRPDWTRQKWTIHKVKHSFRWCPKRLKWQLSSGHEPTYAASGYMIPGMSKPLSPAFQYYTDTFNLNGDNLKKRRLS